MKAEREVTEEMVLKVYCSASVSIINGWRAVRSSKNISEHFKISRYMARKLIKRLVEAGLLQAGYYGGADEDYIFCYHGYTITEKARETREYKKAKFEEAKTAASVFGGTVQEYWRAIK